MRTGRVGEPLGRRSHDLLPKTPASHSTPTPQPSATAPRARVVRAQAGDPETLRLWRVLVGESVRYFDEVYAKLGVLLTDDDLVGESWVQPDAPRCRRGPARASGLLRENEGRSARFPPGFTNREGEPPPAHRARRATADSAMRRRTWRLSATGSVVSATQQGSSTSSAPEQSQHLEMCFAVARMAGWLPDGVSAEHVSHGSILGGDRKRLRTRSGETVKLIALLDEAVERAREAVLSRSAAYDDREIDEIAEAVGIGAIKYADLSTDRDRDYIFDFDRMLAFDGDTGPYLQYAHARIRSVLRRAEDEGIAPAESIALVEEPERALGLALLRFSDAIAQAGESARPNRLSAHLLEVASRFTTFYERCPIARAPDPEVRGHRLALSAPFGADAARLRPRAMLGIHGAGEDVTRWPRTRRAKRRAPGRIRTCAPASGGRCSIP